MNQGKGRTKMSRIRHRAKQMLRLKFMSSTAKNLPLISKCMFDQGAGEMPQIQIIFNRYMYYCVVKLAPCMERESNFISLQRVTWSHNYVPVNILYSAFNMDL